MKDRKIRIYVTGAVPPRKCELCGQVDELRPYGPHGENICFDCLKADEDTAREKFRQLLEGSKP